MTEIEARKGFGEFLKGMVLAIDMLPDDVIPPINGMVNSIKEHADILKSKIIKEGD